DIQPMLARLIGSDIEIRHELEPRLLTVRCELAALEQVLVNLALNARDAMPDGGRLTFRTENIIIDAHDNAAVPPGPYALLTVRDNGIGMRADIATRVFEPFFTTRAPDAGSGLGLSTVYSILRQIGGDVTVETAPGAGAAFRLLFPGHDLPVPRTNELPAQSDAGLQGTETVLVAEDDVGVRALVVATLQRYGYRVMAAVDGLQALDLFRTYGHLIDIIVTDVNMPELKGPEFVGALVDDGAAVPVLYISGFTAETLRLRDSAPRHGFLAKPFAPVELAREVRRMLP
ncbi:MAG: ATP-binding protein, partial [Longimicrobiales bacterium]